MFVCALFALAEKNRIDARGEEAKMMMKKKKMKNT